MEEIVKKRGRPKGSKNNVSKKSISNSRKLKKMKNDNSENDFL